MNKKINSGRIVLALMLIVLLAAGCTIGEKKEEQKNENNTVQGENIENDNGKVGEIKDGEEAVENEAEDNNEEEENNMEANEVEETSKVSEWKLISGNPNDTCSSPTYSGEAEVRGFYVYDVSYVDKEWLLQILPEDATKVPVNKVYDDISYANWLVKPQFSLNGATPELVEELKSATKDNPKTITIKGFKAYCEGVPQVSLSEF